MNNNLEIAIFSLIFIFRTNYSPILLLMLLITSLESADSTNSYLLNLINSRKVVEDSAISIDIPEFYTVSANYQTTGRGQKNNVWTSEPGKNILLSTVIYPMVTAEDQFFINMSISLGILDFCKELIDSDELSIKWPNDIYYKDQKLGGVLIEHTIMGTSMLFSIIGIGLNINQLSFPESLPNPVSLSQISHKSYNIDQCIRNLLGSITRRYNRSLCPESNLKQDYISSLYRYQKEHRFIFNETEIQASITDINQHGMLCLKTAQNKQIECGFKEISYVI